MNIAIVDDDENDYHILITYIDTFCQKNNILCETCFFKESSEFLKCFTQSGFDIIFLDIFMENISGIDTAKQIRKSDRHCKIIFTTSSPDHALLGYQVHAFDYLLKPYSYDKFCTTFGECCSLIRRVPNYIEVKESRTMIKINTDCILYTDYSNHYIQIHTEFRMIKSYLSFPEFSKLLLCYKNFLNCYRNCIINMDKVSSLTELGFVLENGECIPITRSKRLKCQQIYADYIFSL